MKPRPLIIVSRVSANKAERMGRGKLSYFRKKPNIKKKNYNTNVYQKKSSCFSLLDAIWWGSFVARGRVGKAARTPLPVRLIVG